MTDYEKVREAMANLEDVTCGRCEYGETCDWVDGENVNMICPKGVDQILNLQVDNLAIAIVRTDGELPEGVGECMDCCDSFKMLKAGYTHPIIHVAQGSGGTGKDA